MMTAIEIKTAYPITYKRLLQVRRSMKSRCTNPNHKSYKNYGAKGITICDEWLNDNKSFVEWMVNNGYPLNDKKEKLNGRTATIDRIDSSKGYSPDNCRIISHSENSGLARRGITSNTKPVSVYDIDGNFIEELEHQLKVRDKYGLSLTHIKEILEPLHSRKSSKGYRLAYHNVEKLKPLEVLSKKDYTEALEVSLYTLGGSKVKTYNSIQEASDDTGVDCRSIWYVCDKKHPFSQNKRFRYGSDESIEPLQTSEYKGLQSKYPTPIEAIEARFESERFVVDYKNDIVDRLGVKLDSVSRVLKGARKTCGGYRLRYI